MTRAQPQQVGTMHAAPAHLHRALLPGQFSSHLQPMRLEQNNQTRVLAQREEAEAISTGDSEQQVTQQRGSRMGPRGVNSLSISASELQLPVLAPGSGAGEDPAASPAAPTVSGCV